jgi:adenylosuccinate synthase
MYTESFVAVVGAQYGSEGKGVVVHRLATRQHYEFHIRTGGPNAGHSFVHQGRPFTVQSVPVGFVDPNASLVLGAGAVINPRLLEAEIAMLEEAGFEIRNRLYIDANATVLSIKDERSENHTAGELHQRIGSTGEGVGAARLKRIRRDMEEHSIVMLNLKTFDKMGMVCDTVSLLDKAQSFLLEGTQGSGLSLVHGPWPFCTSADTNAAQLCADAGISPLRLKEVMLVARTMPIRVAGNSGPLINEVSWQALSDRLKKFVIERTTVTKKVRRIGEWDDELFRRAVRLNGPRPSVALTFLDYLNPEDEGVTKWSSISDVSARFVYRLENEFDVSVKLAGTGVHETEGWQCIEL